MEVIGMKKTLAALALGFLITMAVAPAVLAADDEQYQDGYETDITIIRTTWGGIKALYLDQNGKGTG